MNARHLYRASPHNFRTAISAAVLVLASACPAVHAQQTQGRYFNADGSKTNDLEAAAKTWRTPEFLQDHALGDVKAEYAYAQGITGKGVKIGEVDSGILINHPQFENQFTALKVEGTYANDGEQLDGHGATWKKGDKFSVPGAYDPLFNDSHGIAAAGEMIAKRNATGNPAVDHLHGIAFDAHLYVSNTHGTDNTAEGPNVDYAYFKEAYAVLARAGARVINSSWGQSPTGIGDYGDVFEANHVYAGFLGKKTFLDSAAEVSLEHKTIQVWAGGNTGLDNPDAPSILPYFRPEIEKYWVAVTGVTRNGTGPVVSIYDRCGIAKYWCIAGPTVDITSTSVGNGSDNDYLGDSQTPQEKIAHPALPSYTNDYNGTSAAAPNVTASLALIMQRFSYLGNVEARDILFTTAAHLGSGPKDVPDVVFGWGVPDLKKAMGGPGGFLRSFEANLPAGVRDEWSNDISEGALIQRKKEDADEIAAWKKKKSDLDLLNGTPAELAKKFAATITPEDIKKGKEIFRAAVVVKNLSDFFGPADFKDSLQEARKSPTTAVLLGLFDQIYPGWLDGEGGFLDHGAFIALWPDEKLKVEVQKAMVENFILTEQRIAGLSTLTDADYRGSLVKSGAGSLTLSGNNSYSGGTQLQAGTLGVGSSTALGTGTLAISDAATLQAAVDGLNLQNAVALSGMGNIDTQAFGFTLSGNLTDAATGPGGIAKLGTGTLTLSGVNSYSGATGVMAGSLRAGSLTGFSPNSAFFVDAPGTLDLNGFNQSIGSLSGAGKVSLGAATLRTGADNTSTAFAGQIAGSGGLTKIGSGTFELSGANSYTGGTSLKAGQFNLGHNSALGTGALSMDDGTTLGFTANGLNVANNVVLAGTRDPVIDTGTFTATLAGVISGAGALGKNGSGTLITTGMNTYSGATTVAAGTLQAGAVNTFSPSSAMTVNAGAALNLAGYSQRVAGLTNAGTVSLIGSVPGTTLTVAGPWVGQGGTLRMSVGAGLSDRLVLSGSTAIASGTTSVQLTGTGGLGAATVGNGIALFGTTDGASIQPGAFALAGLGGHVDAGAFEHRLQARGGGVYLATNDAAGRPTYRIEAPLLASLPAQLRQTNLAMLGNLRLRGGDDDVKTGAQPSEAGLAGGDRRAWGRVIATDIDVGQGGAVSPSSKGHVSGFQAGTDLLATSNWRAGVYVGQLDGDIRVKGFASGVANLQAGSNDLSSEYLGVYGTWTHDSGFYADAALQAGRHRYTLQPFPGSAIAGRAHSLLASLEVGRSFALGNGLSIEPQLQLIRQHQSLDDAQLPATLVQQRADAGWIARAGLRVKGELDTRAGKLQPYGRVNVYKTANGTDIARFVNPAAVTNIATPNGGTSAELAGGFTLALNQTTALYGEAGKLWSAGGNAKVKSGINASLGVRVRW